MEFVKESTTINEAIADNQPIEIAKFLTELAPQVSNFIESNIQENIKKIFLSPNMGGELSIDFGRWNFDVLDDSMDSIQLVDDKIHLKLGNGEVDETFFDARNKKELSPIENIQRIFSNLLYFHINIEIAKRSYFFPAERTAINLFAKHITSTKAEIKDELDAEVVAGMSDDELGKYLRAQVKSAPKYPYAIREYINFVNNFKPSAEEGPFAELANNMQDALTGGKVHLDQYDQLLFTPNNSTNTLELHLTSSLVKSLSYLILYLKYTAQEHDQVIIDEPELNLHPDLQILLARFIAKMVNGGLKVIISTHSDYLIKQLNNLILLGNLNKEEQHKNFVQEKGYAPDEMLRKNQIGAYFLFEGDIRPINLDDNGLDVPTINDAIRRVDGLAEELFLEIEG